MRKRLKTVFDEIPACEVFADIGCDHGYISEAMVKSGKCRLAVASDISEKCLFKARKTLGDFIRDGRAVTVVSDGFDKLPYADCALIAGMGGEETSAIMGRCENLPETLVLQPMKNLPLVREKLVFLGYAVKKDFVFKADGRFYDLIVAKKGKDTLTEEEKEFGRTNILNPSPEFRERIRERLKVIDGVVADKKANAENTERLEKERERLKKYV